MKKVKKDLYNIGIKQLKKDIKEFLKEQEEWYDRCRISEGAFDEETIEGYANILLNRAVNLL